MQKKVVAMFYKSPNGTEPVKKWLQSLDKTDRKKIGADIQFVEYSWPIGMPKVEHIEGDIWQIRTSLENTWSRVFFVVEDGMLI